MPNLAQNRLVRKEVALGTIRELQPPQDHMGLQIAPMYEVPTDDVIFDYMKGQVTGLAPARAEDAESALAQKDNTFIGEGRASLIDWAIKDHYSASDVTRYREALILAQRMGVNIATDFPLAVGSMAADFQAKVARDDALRRAKLDNRLEWMIFQALETGVITYNDGKIAFTVDYGRPANQTDQAPVGGVWSSSNSDPIGAIQSAQDFMWDLYQVRMTRAIAGRKVLRNIVNSDRFAARSGLVGASGGLTIDPRYVMDGWGAKAAQEVVERATGLRFIGPQDGAYDSMYRTRPIGSNTVTNNRFFSENKIILLPDEADVAQFDDAIGFGKTLTSPHPEGNWTAGFYEWEEEKVDPWGVSRGTGIKMFPVFPHLELSYTMVVL